MLYRKDKSPQETICTIIKLLKSNNIHVKWKFYSFAKSFYSCRVYIKDYKVIGTNGKGITKQLALASGLSEFMERLQSFNLIKPYFCNSELKIHDLFTAKISDEVLFTNNSMLVDDKYYYIKKISPNDYNECVKYWDFFNKKNCFIPYLYIHSVCGTNGLCAGNSFYEAVCQGICEIFERYCIKRYLINNISLPSISKNDLKIYEIYKYIEHIEKLGFNVLIKDLSFGKYPVVGVLVYKNNKYLFSAGSDIDINIAIQRCLTEIFQGLSNIKLKNKFKHFSQKKSNSIENFHKMVISNDASIDKHILDGETISLKDLPFCHVNNNVDAFNKLQKILRSNTLSLYITDYSFLKYDTYHVYIPNLSEINNFNIKSFQDKFILKKFMFNSNNNYTYTKILSDTLQSAKFRRCGKYFGSDIMFKGQINNMNSLGLYQIYKNNLNKLNNYQYDKFFTKIKMPNQLQCKNCNLKKKCYYKKWQKYFSILQKEISNFKT